MFYFHSNSIDGTMHFLLRAQYHNLVGRMSSKPVANCCHTEDKPTSQITFKLFELPMDVSLAYLKNLCRHKNLQCPVQTPTYAKPTNQNEKRRNLDQSGNELQPIPVNVNEWLIEFRPDPPWCNSRWRILF